MSLLERFLIVVTEGLALGAIYVLVKRKAESGMRDRILNELMNKETTNA